MTAITEAEHRRQHDLSIERERANARASAETLGQRFNGGLYPDGMGRGPTFKITHNHATGEHTVVSFFAHPSFDD